MNNFDIKEVLSAYKGAFFKSKRYLLIYLIFISLTFMSTFSQKNVLHPKFEFITFILVLALGMFCILFYFLHRTDNELFKTAFVVILCFGIVCAMIVPIIDVSDEAEHLTRAEITSQGSLIPHWTGDDMGLNSLYNHTEGELSNKKNIGCGYETIESIHFFLLNGENTVFETPNDTDRIDYTPFIWDSAFAQNPFWGYLPQALGIFVAKLLDLSAIWILWLARICNLICYACLISLAIKITPKFKIPLLAVSCIPITIYQAASASIDSMLFGLGILAVGYFIRLCLSQDGSISIKKIMLFTALCILLGLCKLPYLAFIFLILFIPKRKFENDRKVLIAPFACVVITALIGILWSRYSTPLLMHSWRSMYNYINPAQQMNFLIGHPIQIFKFLQQIFTTELVNLANGVFNFFHGRLGAHYTDHYTFITICLQLFLVAILFIYPRDVKFDLKTRIGALFVLLVVYIGTCFIQLLTWAYVGKMSLGISIRYFIPLLALIPIILNINYKKDIDRKFDDYSMVFIIGFLATLILAFATKYY